MARDFAGVWIISTDDGRLEAEVAYVRGSAFI
jgi:hypothetical protein